jgi:hypothetical protein
MRHECEVDTTGKTKELSEKFHGGSGSNGEVANSSIDSLVVNVKNDVLA